MRGLCGIERIMNPLIIWSVLVQVWIRGLKSHTQESRLRLKKLWRLVLAGRLVAVGVLLAGCALPASTRPGLSVRLVYPRSGLVDVLPGAEIHLFGEATAPGGGVTRMVFYANGLVIGEDASPLNQGTYTTAIARWLPTEPGEYLVQVEAFRSDGTVFSAANRVCVLPASDLDPLDGFYFYQGYGYMGPCELPRPNPDAPPDLAVSMVARAIPASLAYDFECPAAVANPTIAFEATLDDPSDRVVFVSVDYSVLDSSASGFTADTIALNWTSSTGAGEKIFTGTSGDLTLTLRDGFEAEGGLVSWTARAIGRSGDVLAQDGPYDILATPCTAAVIIVPMPIVIESTATLTPFPTETSTPTLVPVVPTKKSGGDGGGGGGCGSHGDKDSCSAAGCTWDVDKKSCS